MKRGPNGTSRRSTSRCSPANAVDAWSFEALTQGKLKSWDHQPLVDASQQ